MLFHALRQRRVPLALRIAAHSVVLVALAMVIYAWVMGMQFKQAMQQQADALGQALTTQTAASATELLVANDILSLNVLLSNLVKNPLVAHAAIYSVDQRILAEAGTRPSRSVLGETEGLYSTQITFQEVMAGQLRISLDMRQFRQPMTISLQSMGILSLILLALALALSMRLGRYISTPLLEMRLWLRDPDHIAPGSGRQDEIGDLARQLEARLAPPAPTPTANPKMDSEDEPGFADDDLLDTFDDEPPLGAPVARQATAAQIPTLKAEDDFDVSWHDEAIDDSAFADLMPKATPAPTLTPVTPTPAPAVSRRASAVLAIQLGAQEQLRRLPRTRLLELLERYRDCLEQAAALYQGQLHTLKDGSSLMLFHERECDEDYLTHAICCGELMRALGHALQIEVADSGITLQLQLGLTIGEDLEQLSSTELLLSDSALDALALSQHSRNLLLVEQRVANDSTARQRARIRPIASPEGASCVERLLDPYPALLERQLSRMHDSRAH